MPVELIEIAANARLDTRNRHWDGSYMFGGYENIYIPQEEMATDPAELVKLHTNIREEFADLLLEQGSKRVDNGDLWLGKFLAKIGLKQIGSDHALEAHKRFLETDLPPENRLLGQFHIDDSPVSVQTYSFRDIDPHDSSNIIVKVPEISYNRGYLHLYKNHGELWVNRGARMKNTSDYSRFYRTATLEDYRQFGQLPQAIRENISTTATP